MEMAAALCERMLHLGFRFNPTPQEAITHTLPLHPAIRPFLYDADIYACEPGVLAAQFRPTPRDGNRFFFTFCKQQPQKAGKSSRAVRAAGPGSWHSQGNTTDVKDGAVREDAPPRLPLQPDAAGGDHPHPAPPPGHPPVPLQRRHLCLRARRPRRPVPPHAKRREPLLLHLLQAVTAEGGEIKQGHARRRPGIVALAGQHHRRQGRRGRQDRRGQEAAVQEVGKFTDWLMDEFSCCSQDAVVGDTQRVLCKIYFSPHAGPDSIARQEDAAAAAAFATPAPEEPVAAPKRPAPSIAEPPCPKRPRREVTRTPPPCAPRSGMAPSSITLVATRSPASTLAPVHVPTSGHPSSPVTTVAQAACSPVVAARDPFCAESSAAAQDDDEFDFVSFVEGALLETEQAEEDDDTDWFVAAMARDAKLTTSLSEALKLRNVLRNYQEIQYIKKP
ncbi:hypothetical protein EJB05_29667, partial [Eragrostis curvula]